MSGRPGAVDAKDAELGKSTSASREPFDVLDKVPEGAREGARRIAFETTASLADVVDAFLDVRPETETDEEALRVVSAVARGGTGMRAPSYRGFRGADGAGFVAEGGAKSPALPAERALDGTPDPEIGKMVAAGASRYHLDALRELEAESRDAAREERVRLMSADRAACEEAIRPVLMLSVAAAVLAVGIDPGKAPTLSFGSAVAQEKIDEIERVRLEMLGRDMARAVAGDGASAAPTRVGAAAAEEVGERLDRALERGCGAAPCRTLKECLCVCKRCRSACASRKNRR